MTGPFAGTVDSIWYEMLAALCPEGDKYMLALYVNSQALTPALERYTPKGEVSARGYVTGGVQLTGRKLERRGSSAILSFDPPSWKNITAKNVEAGLLYNASKEVYALSVMRFKEPISATNGPLTLTDRLVVEIGGTR